MAFKKLRSVRKPYKQQGYIYFTCLTFDKQDKKTKDKILRLCKEVAGEDWQVLFAFLTRENVGVRKLEQEYYVCSSKIYEYRRKFYERW